MTWTHAVITKLGQTKSVIGAIILIGGVIVSALGISKVPAQQRAIAETLDAHNKQSHDQTDETNQKLDVLICLQAKLDTPIRCVAREKNH